MANDEKLLYGQGEPVKEKETSKGEGKDARLVPFTVEALDFDAARIPPGVQAVEAPPFWEKGFTGEGVIVAVLDTGIDRDHPDLRDRIIDGKNFTEDGDSNDFSDGNGHGTHVAGTIAAHSNDGGVRGVAPNCKLLVGKVLDEEGSGYFDWIIEGIKWATNWSGPKGEKVRIISMSLGGPMHVPELQKAVEDAVSKGIVVVCAAGNEGDADEHTFEYSYPSNYNQVVSVAAATDDLHLAPFSNTNQEVDVIAPGVDVLSTWVNGAYAVLSGTSMATPHVAGVLALLVEWGEVEFGRTLTEAEIYALMVKRTVSIGLTKSSEGHGFVRLMYMDKVNEFVSYAEKIF